MLQDTSKSKIKQNKKIHTLTMTKEAVKVYNYFGQLQFKLLEHKPMIIAIGLVK